MANGSTKKFSEEQQRRREQIVARLLVKTLTTLLLPDDYRITVLDRLLVMHAVRKSEGDGQPGTVAQIAKDLRMPESNVRRALGDLVMQHVLERVGRYYRSAPVLDADERRRNAQLDVVVADVLMAAKELIELDGSKLLITRKNGDG
jgi:hypothetical protein